MHVRTIWRRAAVVMRMAMPERPGEGRRSSHVVNVTCYHPGAFARRSGRGRDLPRE